MYVDASEGCVNVNFKIGSSALSSKNSRKWNIKITQFKCDYINLAPSGCTQYFFNKDGTGQVRTFNYENSFHLAQQRQQICVR